MHLKELPAKSVSLGIDVNKKYCPECKKMFPASKENRLEKYCSKECWMKSNGIGNKS